MEIIILPPTITATYYIGDVDYEPDYLTDIQDFDDEITPDLELV